MYLNHFILDIGDDKTLKQHRKEDSERKRIENPSS